jgi:hypothetical protein
MGCHKYCPLLGSSGPSKANQLWQGARYWNHHVLGLEGVLEQMLLSAKFTNMKPSCEAPWV